MNDRDELLEYLCLCNESFGRVAAGRRYVRRSIGRGMDGDGRISRAVVSRSERRERRKEHPEKSREFALKRNYKMTLGQFDELFIAQGGVCAICGLGPSGKRRHLTVDHDHTTGKVRALLCGPCNVALGNAKDNPKILRAAAEYVEYHSGPFDVFASVRQQKT